MRRLLAVLVLAALAGPLDAHEMRPAYLELRESGDGTWSVVFKVPARGPDKRLALYVRLPNDCEPIGLPRTEFHRAAFIDRSTIRRAGGLAGAEIYIEGLSTTLTDVLARVEREDGTTQVVRLTPDTPSFVVGAAPGWFQIARTYLELGVEHILGGIDHLLFVLALLLLVVGWRRLAWTITAFTVAHSLTLAAATLGFVSIAPQPAVLRRSRAASSSCRTGDGARPWRGDRGGDGAAREREPPGRSRKAPSVRSPRRRAAVDAGFAECPSRSASRRAPRSPPGAPAW